MKFKVIDRTTGEPLDANDYAERYWKEQALHRCEHPKKQALPFLFFKKCDWLIDTDGDLHIQDSCGNVVSMDNKRFEAVVE